MSGWLFRIPYPCNSFGRFKLLNYIHSCMTLDKTLHRGREAFRLMAWADAYTQLSRADKEASVKPEDLEKLAIAAYLMGNSSESNDIWSRAHHDYLNNGDVKCAVRCAFWLGFTLLNKGESARGGGWISRAGRLLDEGHLDCVEKGYLLLPVALRCLGEGDAKGSFTTFEQAGKIGARFRDSDLMTLSRLGRGQALIRLKETPYGLSLLDEAMAAVDSGEISPIVVGIVYCAVIEACLEIFDLRRAHEWTEALSAWCASQPQLVPFRGQCLIRRSEIMQLHGAWQEAIEEAHKASELLSRSNGEPAAGTGYYQLGELHRLRGDFIKAEEAFRQSNKWGRNPQPGLALLRLAQDQVEMAKVAIQHTLQEAKNIKTRTRTLPAYIEIMLVANDPRSAHIAVNELIEIANELDAPILHAMAAQAEGAIFLYDGNVQSALERLRRAWMIWEKLHAPYESARVRLLIGIACQKTGDMAAAEMEYEAARWTFHQLKAIPDIARLDTIVGNRKPGKIHGLTPRELQVLRLLATGKTNHHIAAELFVSERTVDRHVSNILGKLDVPSRAAATAYAYEHHLI
jgi:DNA-binding CsgD family transcriptional regulator/tetratricopeptide (TPR) repeat protein